MTCPPDNKCNTYACNPLTGSCTDTPTNCDDNNPVGPHFGASSPPSLPLTPAAVHHLGTSNASTTKGCVHTNIKGCTCSCGFNGDNCTNVQCLSNVCTNISRCSPGPAGLCYNYEQCSLSTGCVQSFRCDDNNPCTVDTCDANTGACSNVQMNCDDGNACTVDACSGGVCSHTLLNCDLGAKCLHFSCDQNLGCQYVPVNASVECDDYDECTTDICVNGAGCLNVNITDNCTTGDPCQLPGCDPLRGCTANIIYCPDGDPSQCQGIGSCSNGTCGFAATACDSGLTNTGPSFITSPTHLRSDRLLRQRSW